MPLATRAPIAGLALVVALVGRQTAVPAAAAGAYLLLAIGYTWPLAAGLTRDVPWDMGDPLLNIWILGWGADHLLRALGGDVQALAGFWNANIFHPEPLTLAYSEHLIAQVIQILPVYAATGNLILCYNLLFLSTFTLAGLGMFLLIRQVTGSALAGFVAGLVFAFMPLRVPQFSHLQVMSSHWMPFVLFGLRRYFDTGRRRALAGGAFALVMQNLSCGYFLLYFAPFVGIYGIWELASRRRLRDPVAWRDLSIAAVAVIGGTVPFLVPYLQLRSLGFPARPLREVAAFSADVYSYLTASIQARLAGQTWGVRAMPKPEGELFPSLAALVLAGVGAVTGLRRAADRAVTRPPRSPWYVRGLLVVAGFYAGLATLVLFGFGFTRLGPLEIRATDITRSLAVAGTALLGAVCLDSPIRQRLRRWGGSFPAFCLVAAIVAVILSWGPTVAAMGRPVWTGAPYTLLYEHVPGFDGLRVPARYAVIAMVFVSALAGVGAAALQARWSAPGAPGAIVAIGLAFAVFIEGMAAPIVMNGVSPEPGLLAPPARIFPGSAAPPEYQFVRTLPVDAVLAEFPFGSFGYELRYMYYSTGHWRRLVNGYSGTFPPSYEGLLPLLRAPTESPERSWSALIASGASHVIVHEDAYGDAEAARSVTAWLSEHGAEKLAGFVGAAIFRLPR